MASCGSVLFRGGTGVGLGGVNGVPGLQNLRRCLLSWWGSTWHSPGFVLPLLSVNI